MTCSIHHGLRIRKIASTLIFPTLLLLAVTANARSIGANYDEKDNVFSRVSSNEHIINDIKINEGAPLASVNANDINSSVTDPQDALPGSRPGRPETAIAITQDNMLAGPPYTAYSPLGGFTGNPSSLPRYAVKSNLLYAAGTLTPNLAVEFGLSGKASLVISGAYNPWNRKGSVDNNDKLVHWIIRPEFRYWLCERFNGHFFGANPFFTQFNVGGKKLPFVDFRKEYRYEGYAAGAGVNYGYQFPLGKRWGLELAIGVGAAYMKYDVYDCVLCGEIRESKTKWYFGPTHAAINLVFLIK